MSDWSGEFNHESITPENRESFNTFASKYDSPEAAIVGGFNAQKAIGAPFKFPESMDNLPDDASRADFTSRSNQLLGREFASDVKDLDSLDLKMGASEGTQTDDALANAFKQFIVEKKIAKADAQDMLSFHNDFMGKARVALAEKKEADFEATAKQVEADLAAHPDFGSMEEVSKQSELFKRAIRNHVGLTNDEAEEFADAIIEAGMTRNAVVARVMLNQFAPLAAEGSTDGGGGAGGGGAKGPTPYEFKQQLHPKSQGLWGKPTDTWENEGIEMRKRAGIK